ncbi:outer membrane protein [uncultured Cedecea sp.]|uniref:outer membrane protein n=1 Tax=uncultured Cedecea sp. TaxID=988762 RepID=UPI002633FA13|nr:outer membrane protein [uncultured Cedecea sp.]
MKKTFIASTVAIATLYTCAVSANNGVYVTGELGSSVVNIHDTKADYSEAVSGIVDYRQTTKLSNTNKGVFSGGIAVGYDFNDQGKLPVRLELAAKFRGNAEGSQTLTDEYGYSDTVKNKVRMDTYMVNGYYDFYNSSDFTPYLTAGVGLSRLKHKISDGSGESMSASANNFAWGVGAGVKYAVTSNISVDASYRYVDGGKVTNSRTDNFGSYTGTLDTTTKAASNDLMLGVSYKF